jgi:4-hydroxy-2-oxoheptanedioate aldolase
MLVPERAGSGTPVTGILCPVTAGELKSKLAAGANVFGTLIVSPSPRYPEAVKDLGLDFVFIDTEHIALGRHDLSWMCRCYAALGLPPIVRITEPNPHLASQALDGGAAGVVAPYVETPEQAQALCGAVKLGRLKGKRLARALTGEEALEDELQSYLENRNRDWLSIVNIESTPAIENLDAILDVPGLDGVLLGPHDLSCSLGLPEQYEHPRFTEAISTMAGKTRDRGLIAGVHFVGCGSMSLAAAWMDLGFNLQILRSDILYVREGLRRDLAEMRQQPCEDDATDTGNTSLQV